MNKNLIINSITMHKHMPKFYDYNGQKYSICFPIEWATNHLEQTGPVECMNCLHYGCTYDVFTTYCINCQVYEYNFTRIPGNNVTCDFICNNCDYDDTDPDYDDTDTDHDDDDSVISDIFTYNTTNCKSSVMPLFIYTPDGNEQLNLSPYSNNYNDYDYDYDYDYYTD